MATTKTSTYCSRDSAALLLFKHLGPHNWHKDLHCTTERTRPHRGYKGSGLMLAPRCLYQNRPFYELAEVMAFITEMKRRHPELGPSGIKGVQLRVSTNDQRDVFGTHGFRLNKAEKA